MRERRAAWAQKLPGGVARERLRQKGQFWTPDWVADAMVAYALAAGSKDLYDPAAGTGAFFDAARRLQTGARLRGMELDDGLPGRGDAAVDHGDFVLAPPQHKLAAIVANPPYLRHHRIPAHMKSRLHRFARQLTGISIDGRAGLHVYFLLRALERLAPGGRLAFILPADTFEGVFAPKLWRWISDQVRLDAVVTFAPEAAPFPAVDTNALIVLLAREIPVKQVVWARCLKPRATGLARWAARPIAGDREGMTAVQRDLEEALNTGLSRPVRTLEGSAMLLGEVVSVMRGIATGANEFFFMTAEQVRTRKLAAGLFRRAIGRTRDVDGDEVGAADLERLDATGRATFLLSLGAEPMETLPAALRAYLREGERAGLAERALISTRKPWYKMETRTPPPFLFAYLGRRSSRFIRNRTGVVPLTGFLCVYPRADYAGQVEALWKLLNHPGTIANLARVGKSYGDGAIKVEPRALERLPIPASAMKASGFELRVERGRQERLAFEQGVS